jgi:chitodextrinase
VTRSVGSVGAVTVNYATSDGSASAGGDYTSTSGTLSWAAGETANKTFAVPILNDALIESAETINLTLSSVTGGAVIGISAGTITINPDDDTPPTIPTNLAGTPSGAAVNLGWTASTDNVGVAGYRIFRNGVQIGTSTTTTYSDSTGLAGTTTYSYFVDAYDAANNVSGFTSPINVTTSDWEPPTVPQGLSATAVSASQINLSWTASTDSGGAGLSRYRVWRGTTLVSDFSAATTFSDVLLSASTTYSYTVAAVDNAGNQSAASASASATTFAPPPDPPGTPSWTNGWGLCGGACITYSGSEVLTWQVTSGGTASYYEQQSSNGAGSWQTDQTTTNPEAAVGIPLAQIRRFRVRACNVAGCSPYSSDIGIYYDPNP